MNKFFTSEIKTFQNNEASPHLWSFSLFLYFLLNSSPFEETRVFCLKRKWRKLFSHHLRRTNTQIRGRGGVFLNLMEEANLFQKLQSAATRVAEAQSQHQFGRAPVWVSRLEHSTRRCIEPPWTSQVLSPYDTNLELALWGTAKNTKNVFWSRQTFKQTEGSQSLKPMQ